MIEAVKNHLETNYLPQGIENIELIDGYYYFSIPVLDKMDFENKIYEVAGIKGERVVLKIGENYIESLTQM